MSAARDKASRARAGSPARSHVSERIWCTADAAREFVRTQAKDGADLFKITGGPRDGILAAMDEADGLRLDVAGHLPGSLSTQEAIAAGWDTFEHLGSGLDNILDYSPAAPQIRE